MSLGILYKDAEALQKAKDVNCVLLDKTATLTIGEPKVTDFECLHSDKRFALQIAVGIESHSNHPIAECVRAFSLDQIGAENVLEVENYHYEIGKGATGVYQEKVYRLGNRRLLGKIAEKEAYLHEKRYSEQGKTVVFLANEEKLLAVFALADTLKEQTAEAIEELK